MKEQDTIIVKDGSAPSAEPSTHRGCTDAQIAEAGIRCVVSGEPRSGTSLMMKLLQTAGLQIGGIRRIGKRAYRNPTGFWEVENLVYNGLHLDETGQYWSGVRAEDGSLERLPLDIPKGTEVLKLVTVGMLRSDYRFLKKVIFCIRDPREIAVSARGMNKWESDEKTYLSYKINMLMVLDNVKPKAFEDTICIMDYKKLVKKPWKELPWLLHFLELDQNLVKDLSKKINKKYYRSKPWKAQRDEDCQKIYEILLNKMYKQRALWSSSADLHCVPSREGA